MSCIALSNEKSEVTHLRSKLLLIHRVVLLSQLILLPHVLGLPLLALLLPFFLFVLSEASLAPLELVVPLRWVHLTPVLQFVLVHLSVPVSKMSE